MVVCSMSSLQYLKQNWISLQAHHLEPFLVVVVLLKNRVHVLTLPLQILLNHMQLGFQQLILLFNLLKLHFLRRLEKSLKKLERTRSLVWLRVQHLLYLSQEAW